MNEIEKYNNKILMLIVIIITTTTLEDVRGFPDP